MIKIFLVSTLLFCAIATQANPRLVYKDGKFNYYAPEETEYSDNSQSNKCEKIDAGIDLDTEKFKKNRKNIFRYCSKSYRMPDDNLNVEFNEPVSKMNTMLPAKKKTQIEKLKKKLTEQWSNKIKCPKELSKKSVYDESSSVEYFQLVITCSGESVPEDTLCPAGYVLQLGNNFKCVNPTCPTGFTDMSKLNRSTGQCLKCKSGSFKYIEGQWLCKTTETYPQEKSVENQPAVEANPDNENE